MNQEYEFPSTLALNQKRDVTFISPIGLISPPQNPPER
jgi:hypothetical protein